jgi:hypothetical protein
MGIVAHDNACPPTQSTDAYCRQAWGTHPERPVGNLYLARDGEVIMGCAGASNCAGKGGPWRTSKGAIPLNMGNQNTINVEVGNNGVNEHWAPAMIDRYIELLARLSRHYGLNPLTDIAAHHEWAVTDGRGTILGSRGRPSRKIDISGPQGRYPYINPSLSWNYDLFRADVNAWGDAPPLEEDDEMIYVGYLSSGSVVLINSSCTAGRYIQENEKETFERNGAGNAVDFFGQRLVDSCPLVA